MLCYWGEEVRAGFGLLKADGVQRSDWGVSCCSPKTRITQISPGGRLLGFLRGEGNVSFIRLQNCKLRQLELKDKIRLMSCGEDQAVLLTHAGKTLQLNKFNNCSPIKELAHRNVVQIACGDQHCMALTHDGQLFTWGQNSSGQLGLGKKDESSFPSPQPLKSMTGIPLAQISAGGDHSFALSLSGAVFGWGRNSAGQLGLGDREDRYIPVCVSNLNRKKTIFISCGAEHTATLSQGGTVFTFGSGRFGQLGHNSFRDELRPRVVSELWGNNVSQITCGRLHTLALVQSSNTIYSFGCGEKNLLGNGQQTNQCVPLPVHLPPEANHDKRVDQIFASGDHSFVLCSRQKADSSSVHASPNQERGLLTLENSMIDRWLSECDSKQWKTIEKEIKTVFSSPGCLNGSFLKKSCDEHYQTSTSCSGLDMEAVRAAFERLAKNDKVLLEVVKVVKKDLLPSLSFTGVGEAAESVRIYLILPELIRVLNNPLHVLILSAQLASSILKLSPFMLQVLENYWSVLPDDFLKPLVELYRKPSATFIEEMTLSGQEKLYVKFLKKYLPVLQMVYKASCREKREITSKDFVIHEINDFLLMWSIVEQAIYEIEVGIDIYTDFFMMLKEEEYLLQTIKIMFSSPCIFNMEAKSNLLNVRPVQKVFEMELRRTALLEDCFDQLRAADKSVLKGPLLVVYSEKHERTDVNKKDFFHKVFELLLKPESRMFMYNDTETLIWFPTEPSLPEERYFLFGCLCGLVLYNRSVANLPFPLALFKKLTNVPPSLEDLTEFSPVLGKSLQYTLDCSDEDIDCLDMTFSIMWDNKEVELDPEEPGKVVTSSNKKKFVDAYVDYTMNKSVERVFEEFRRGFYKVCDPEVEKLFQPEELRGMMVGTEEYDWDTLKKNAVYSGLFHKSHPTIILFWEVFDELSDQDKKAFLLFLTGFDRVPIMGMDQVRMSISPLYKFTEEHLPEAHTCNASLNLPVYKTKETLRAKLIEALHHRRGFWE